MISGSGRVARHRSFEEAEKSARWLLTELVNEAWKKAIFKGDENAAWAAWEWLWDQRLKKK